MIDALSLQIKLTQSVIGSSVDLGTTDRLYVIRARVDSTELSEKGETSILKVSGQMDWKLKDEKVNGKSPYIIFLEHGKKAQSWRLAKPVQSFAEGSQDWITYPLPI